MRPADRQIQVGENGVTMDGSIGGTNRIAESAFEYRNELGDVVTNGERRVLYRLPELLNSAEDRPDDLVFVLSDEVEADCLHQADLVGTCSPAGDEISGWLPNFTAALTGRHVVIIADRSEHGRNWASWLANELVTPAASARILSLPGVSGVDNWMRAGGTAHELVQLARSTPIFHGDQIPPEAAITVPDSSSVTLANAFIKVEATDAERRRILQFWKSDFFLHDGNAYVRRDQDDFKSRVFRFLKRVDVRKKRADGELYSVRFNPEPHHVKKVMETLATECHLDVDRMPAWIEKPAGAPEANDVIAFHDCLVHIGEFLHDPENCKRPKTPHLFTTTTIPCSFPSHTDIHDWKKFLDCSLSEDQERIDCLQEWFGLCSTRDTSFQKIMFLCGPPGCGKGTSLRQLVRCVGSENCAAPTLNELAQPFGLESLVGATVAIVADAHISGKNSTDVLNTILAITGEDVVNIQRKFLPPLRDVRLGCRFTIGLNRLPRLADSSNAIMRRLLMIPFDVSFEGREDRELEKKLARETAGIVRWGLEGLRRLRKNGKFTEVRAARGLIQAFRNNNSPIEAFVSERCVKGNAEGDEAVKVEVDGFYKAYREWRAEGGLPNEGVSKEGVGMDLLSLKHRIVKRRRGPKDNRKHFYLGIGLLPAGHENMDEEDGEDERQEAENSEPVIDGLPFAAG